MAVIIRLLKRSKNLTLHQNIAEITFDNSYPTGGEPVTAAQLGVRSIDMVMLSNGGGYLAEYDYTNNKIKVLTPTAPHSHIENTAAAYVQNATTAENVAEAASEVANATDLSAVIIRAMVIGI